MLTHAQQVRHANKKDLPQIDTELSLNMEKVPPRMVPGKEAKGTVLSAQRETTDPLAGHSTWIRRCKIITEWSSGIIKIESGCAALCDDGRTFDRAHTWDQC